MAKKSKKKKVKYLYWNGRDSDYTRVGKKYKIISYDKESGMYRFYNEFKHPDSASDLLFVSKKVNEILVGLRKKWNT